MNRTIVIISPVSVQQYIFRSNKLRENVGASWLVKHIMEDGLMERMPGLDCSNWQQAMGQSGYSKPSASTGEVLYLAGGNAVLLFNSKPEADQAVYSWSRWILEQAPGLRVAVGMAGVATECGLQSAFKEAFTRLDHCANSAPQNVPLPALPLIRTCSATGGPASVYDPTGKQYVSFETNAKREAIKSLRGEDGPALTAAEYDFSRILGLISGDKPFQFPLDLSDLGGSEGEARIAVVHIDGNDMGANLQKVTEKDFGDDTQFAAALRRFSASLKNAAFSSFHETLEALRQSLPVLSKQNLFIKENIFPLRPLVYGGDDITFVCDARLGISLAEKYLQLFKGKTLELPDIEIHPSASAGIAIVPAKYPFARAYYLAESLCASAKRKRLQEQSKQDEKPAESWLDFQVVYGGGGNLHLLREKQFRTLEGNSLLYRPWPIDGNQHSQLRFEHLREGINHFNNAWPRSLAKDFKEALTKGKDATKQTIAFYNSRNWKLPLLDGNKYQDNGWSGDTTPYFDCLEMMDSFVNLD
jgi:hypothetical protein